MHSVSSPVYTCEECFLMRIWNNVVWGFLMSKKLLKAHLRDDEGDTWTLINIPAACIYPLGPFFSLHIKIGI